MKTASVIIPLPLSKAFSYEIADDIIVKEGSIVQVPVGNKSYVGVVWKIDDTTINNSFEIKSIKRVYHLPPMNKNLRKLIDWIAEYTVSYPGIVLKMALSSKDALEDEKADYGYRIVSDSFDCKLTTSRKKIIEYIGNDIRSLSDILSHTGASSSVVKGLEKLGVIEKSQIPESQIPKSNYLDLSSLQNLAKLSAEQKNAADEMINAIALKKFSPFLLDGVTGSGKTEVFFAAIAKVLEDDKAQVLIMLPEITLTTQMIGRITKRFGVSPTQWHSGLSASQRRNNWRAIAKGDARLIIGARSALFLPFQNLSFIVVDEEHDSSYKQEDGVIYHARDMAVTYASILKIPIVLASATPSLETAVNAECGKYKHIILPSRYGGATLPNVNIVDMRKSGLTKQQWISPQLQKSLQKNLDDNYQSLLFINRRGYAPLLLCRSCGYRFQCKDCNSWLVEHKKDESLKCHHCGYQQKTPKECPDCGSKDSLAPCGPGVERIEEEVNKIFPNARTLLMTSDNLTTTEKMEEALNKVQQSEVDIIVGTQLIAKGHHFPKLTLVGVIDADIGLSGGDLRAAERTFQLLHQVSGRAGREQEKGNVYIQSYMPDNAIIRALSSGDKSSFLRAEIEGRKYTNSPPFIRYTALIFSAKDESLVKRICNQAASFLKKHESIEVLGPVPAPMFFLRGQYRYRILLKSAKNIKIQTILSNIRELIKKAPAIKLRVDVDPHHFM